MSQPVRENLTPRQVAQAIGVSESSLKRWCDRGVIETVRTAGGHRRLPRSAVLSFIRENGHELADPQVLGLPKNGGQGTRVATSARGDFMNALVAGQEEYARQVIWDLYLGGHSLVQIFDDVIAPAMSDIGKQWDCGDVAVYQERLGVQIVLRILHEFRQSLPPVDTGNLAIGGTAEGDQYVLPTTMVELTLRTRGLRACSLGTSLPFESLCDAIKTHDPVLFWLSVSHIADEAAFLKGFQLIANETRERKIPLVVGGAAMCTDLRSKLPFAIYCDSMQQLTEYLETHPPKPWT
ncbi:helix-turn-helix domain-containing protein [Thalassoroseus pseudoceratinae]|uniref:helix-turn-helix domain-containing protein n=1 Tax=Thalassoroseus pseudoceratinae TaxID=2713176 RepID=UPI001422E85B|nr:helix-turn-helix domain-containing protein [Thalassoroseus pseudoceratinae]